MVIVKFMLSKCTEIMYMLSRTGEMSATNEIHRQGAPHLAVLRRP